MPFTYTSLQSMSGSKDENCITATKHVASLLQWVMSAHACSSCKCQQMHMQRELMAACLRCAKSMDLDLQVCHGSPCKSCLWMPKCQIAEESGRLICHLLAEQPAFLGAQAGNPQQKNRTLPHPCPLALPIHIAALTCPPECPDTTICKLFRFSVSVLLCVFASSVIPATEP